jgi:hypothetical protein
MRNTNKRIDSPLGTKETASFLKMNNRTLVRWARCGYIRGQVGKVRVAVAHPSEGRARDVGPASLKAA